MWRGIADSPGLLASLQPILVLRFLAGVKSGDGFFDAHVIAWPIYIDRSLALFAFVFSNRRANRFVSFDVKFFL